MRTFTIHPKIKKQSGISIVTAIFLVVVLALMGTGMVSLLSSSQQSISQEITSAKTYMAGRSCLQWAMYQSVYAATTGTHNVTFTDTTSGLLKSKCAVTIDTITADSIIFYNLEAAATYGSTQDPEYSARTMQMQFQP